jgi:hypothetical protein
MAAIPVTVTTTILFWILMTLSFVADVAAEFNCTELDTPAAAEPLNKLWGQRSSKELWNWADSGV